ncbi:MAG: putative deacylase [Planctomycetota bacterium]|jgi:predicted deacylase
MAAEKISKTLLGDTPGRSTELTYFRIGPADATKKVYLQGAMHADEQPGILILHHLLELLMAADGRGELNAQFVVFPMVNPLGMGDIEFGRHQGRYNRSSGVNHNRQWPDLSAAVDADITAKLGSDANANVKIVRQALRVWVAGLPEITAHLQWQKILISEACDADYVFDLHCDDDSLVHIFSVPQLNDNMQQLANCVGAAATMTAEDSGDGPFDEVWLAIWLQLARDYPDLPVPLAVSSCTLEYRGNFDVFDALNRQDAENLYGFFQDEKLIAGDGIGNKIAAAAPTDLRATEYLCAEHAGLLVYRAELGDRVKKGDCIAELLHLDGESAFTGRTPVLAGTDGLLLSRSREKYVWRNAQIAKIVGSEILESRTGKLLSD